MGLEQGLAEGQDALLELLLQPIPHAMGGHLRVRAVGFDPYPFRLLAYALMGAVGGP